MQEKISLAVLCALLSLAVVYGIEAGDFINPPIVGGKIGSYESQEYRLERNAEYKDSAKSDENLTDGSFVVDEKDKIKKNQSLVEDNLSANVLAVGGEPANPAALSTANQTLVQHFGINPKHIIGYVPYTPENGAFILPAGAVQVANPAHIRDQQSIGRKTVHKQPRSRKRSESKKRNSRGKKGKKNLRQGSNRKGINPRRSNRVKQNGRRRSPANRNGNANNKKRRGNLKRSGNRIRRKGNGNQMLRRRNPNGRYRRKNGFRPLQNRRRLQF